MKLISWNVNGIRAVFEKGFLEWFKLEKPDVLCLQETKASADTLPKKYDSLIDINDYHSFWSSPTERKGYSGVVTYTNSKPININKNIGVYEFDNEGRIMMTEFKEFMLFNVYFPNGQVQKGDKEGKNPDYKKRLERLAYKMRFYDYFLNYIEDLRQNGKSIIVCGDFNVAHTSIDLARPKDNEENTGYLPEEREWMDKVIQKGYIDTFRKINGNIKDKYTWWTYRGGARERNVGWRIDYFIISKNLEKNLKNAFILDNVTGSDHCPIGIEIKF